MPKEEGFSFKNIFVPLTTKNAITFIIIIGLVVYLNSLFNGFIGDDYGQLVNNAAAHSIGNIIQFFTGSTFNNSTFSGIGNSVSNGLEGIYYKPFLSTVFSILYTFSGNRAFGYHFFQLILHIANSILLFLIFKKFLKRETALGMAFIFLVHPINNESVVFVSALQEPLFMIFGLLAFYLTLSEKQGIGTNIATVLLLLLSILSKETGVLFILIVPLFQILFHKSWKVSLLQSAAVLTIYSIFRFGIAHIYINHNSTLVTIPFINASLAQKLENMPLIIYSYLRVFFYPKDLLMGQSWIITVINFSNFYLPLLIDSVFFLIIALFGVVIYKRHKSLFKYYIFFAIWFVLGLSAHLQLIPLDATISNRWFYFPVAGLIGMIGVILNTLNFNNRRIISIYLITLVVIAILFGVRDFNSNTNWGSELTLYRYETAHSPDDYKLQFTYANAMSNAGNQREALSHILYSIKLHPTAESLDLLALIYVKSNKIENAKSALNMALNLDGNSFDTYVLFAEFMLQYDKPQPTITLLKKFLTKYPNEPTTWFFLAIKEYGLGDKADALFSIKKSLSLYPSEKGRNVYSDILNNKPINVNFSN